MTYNVYIPCYGDLPMLREAVASIPPSAARIYVVDGRYATFDGEPDLTPGAEKWATAHDRVAYVAPDADRLPFGHDKPTGTAVRWPVHDKQRWAFEEVLPQDEWVLKMDTDERVDALDPAVFDRLARDWKAAPFVDTLWARGLAQPRVYVPEYWTYWLADTAVPRALYSRETPAETLASVCGRCDANRAKHLGLTRAIRLTNHGDERPADYQTRRGDQLETMGRDDRAAHYHSPNEAV